MINYSNLYRLYDLLGEIIFYGFHNSFSSEFIEESISSSIIFRDYLDKGNDSFVYNFSQREIIVGTYNTPIVEDDLHKLNTICMWLGEAYMRLYFKYHRPMSFLFLYFSIDKMSNMFGVYHEMDWTQLYQYFEEEIKKKSALSIILKKRQITAYELSVLTGIKYQTIKKYSRSNENIYNASFTNVTKISSTLNINSNVFMEEINNYVDASHLDLKIKNIEYLTNYGHRIISYFDKNIGSKTFEYDNQLEMLKGDDCYLKALIADKDSIDKVSKEYSNMCPVDCDDVFLAIFINEDIEKPNVTNDVFKTVFVLTPQYLFIVSNEQTKKLTIPRLLHEATISLTKPN